MGFVRWVGLMAKGGYGQIKSGGNVGGFKLFDSGQKSHGKTIGGIGGGAVSQRERRNSVVAAMDKRVGVD